MNKPSFNYLDRVKVIDWLYEWVTGKVISVSRIAQHKWSGVIYKNVYMVEIEPKKKVDEWRIIQVEEERLLTALQSPILCEKTV